MFLTIQQAAWIIRTGGVVAYPTEACYGLGCDPKNSDAIRRILRMKHRPRHKGLIIIADHFSKVKGFLKQIPEDMEKEIKASWPGPHTWVFPARPGVSSCLRGSYCSLAVRITAHCGVRKLCRLSQTALVSTSANKANRKPLKNPLQVQRIFANEIDGIVMGRLGHLSQPTQIRDGLTGRCLRV